MNDDLMISKKEEEEQDDISGWVHHVGWWWLHWRVCAVPLLLPYIQHGVFTYRYKDVCAVPLLLLPYIERDISIYRQL